MNEDFGASDDIDAIEPSRDALEQTGDLTDALQVYKAGKLTVVGFGGQDILSDLNLALYRDQLTELIEKHECQELTFDLTGVILVPSGLLGLMATMRDLGVKVCVCNPSKDVREVLSVTKLDEVIEVTEIDL